LVHKGTLFNLKRIVANVKDKLGERAFGGVIGAIVGLLLGGYLSIITPIKNFILLILAITVIGTAIAGTAGTSKKGIIQGAGAAVGGFTIVFLLFISVNYSNLLSGFTFSSLLWLLSVSLIGALSCALISGLLGLLFGIVGTKLDKKTGGSIFFGALGTATGAILGLLLIVNWLRQIITE
jgi:hypothetical protein